MNRNEDEMYQILFLFSSWMCIQIDTKFTFIIIKGKMKALHKPSIVWQAFLKLRNSEFRMH